MAETPVNAPKAPKRRPAPTSTKSTYDPHAPRRPHPRLNYDAQLGHKRTAPLTPGVLNVALDKEGNLVPKPKRGRPRTRVELGYSHIVAHQTPEEIKLNKLKIINLLMTGKAYNITDACEQAGILPQLAFGWAKRDETFAAIIQNVHEVVADELEKELREYDHFIPKMFLLKAYRPEFRDNHKVNVTSETLELLLKELKEANQRAIEANSAKTPPVIIEGKSRILEILPPEKEKVPSEQLPLPL